MGVVVVASGLFVMFVSVYCGICKYWNAISMSHPVWNIQQ